MYLDFQVKIPTESAGITRKKIKGTTYIYYAYEHHYNTEKGYTVPKNTTIGKCTDDDSELMYPNTNFLKFFPAEELPETRGSAYRSGCLRAGTYFVLRKIIAEYHLDEMLGEYSIRDYKVSGITVKNSFIRQMKRNVIFTFFTVTERKVWNMRLLKRRLTEWPNAFISMKAQSMRSKAEVLPDTLS